MMQTSATGRGKGAAADQQRRSGFTLVELLMVVAILGLAAGAVVLSVPDPRPPVGAEAERFAARLVRAREEAVLTNRSIAVEATPRGYGFSQFDGVEWTALTDGPFGDEVWQTETSAGLPSVTLRVVFDPTGASEAATVTLSRDGQASTVSVDGAGEVSVDD